ncbi:PNOC protein, partial [Pomatorhinus ruficollis]|nr:PNOC protein [Pomatorhinus ruficollis]
MRAVLWDLLLLCLFARARGDCRGDCLHCDRQLFYRDSFDVLVSPLSPVTCHLSPVPCHLSPVTCPLSPVTSPPSPVPCPLSPVPCPLSPVRCHLSPVPCPLPPVPCHLFPEEDEDISRRPGEGRAAKGVQKRYGGFIGVRKSARKWNNQKRFSEFLKQYLGMAPRSSEYGPGAAAARDNEI